MGRKITKNGQQYKVTLPIETIRQLNWKSNTSITVQKVKTPMGSGILILEDSPNQTIEVEVEQ